MLSLLFLLLGVSVLGQLGQRGLPQLHRLRLRLAKIGNNALGVSLFCNGLDAVKIDSVFCFGHQVSFRVSGYRVFVRGRRSMHCA